MTQKVNVKLRKGGPSIEIQMPTLIDEIVHGETLEPESLLLDGDSWLALRELRDAPWRESMLAETDRLLRTGKVERAEQLANRVLRFCGSDEIPVAFRAFFYLGVLRASCQQWRESASFFRRSAAGKSCCLSAAHNNLAVAYAMLRDPVASVEHALLAQNDGRMVTALLTQRNLSRVMLREGACDIPGRPSWKELRSRAEAQLQKLNPRDIRSATDQQRQFPSFHVLLVFHEQDYSPEISSRLASPNTGLLGALRLAGRARAALHRGHYEQSILLAEGAQQSSDAVAEQVGPILTTSRLRLDEQRRLQRDTEFADRLAEFFEHLDQLTIDELDAPRESLALLRPYFKNLAKLESLYSQRVCEVISAACLETQDERRRDRLMAILEHYLPAHHAAAHREASGLRHSQKAMRRFREAVLSGDCELAAAALRRVEASLGSTPKDADEILDRLRGESRAGEVVDVLEPISAGLRALDAGDFIAAAACLKTLLPSGAVEETVGLKLRIEAARQLAQTRDSLRAENWDSARHSLRQALHYEPKNEAALTLLLAMELLKADLSGTTALDIARDGLRAIRAFVESDERLCSALCGSLRRTLGPDGLLSHLFPKSQRTTEGD